MVGRVNDIDDGGSVWEVTPPVRPDGGLTAQIPYVEVEVFVCYGLDVETDRGDCRYYLADL